jgi:hypothetical protein
VLPACQRNPHQGGDASLVSESQLGCLPESRDSSHLTQNGPAYRRAVNSLQYVELETIRLRVLLPFNHIPRLIKGEEQYITFAGFCQAPVCGDEGIRTPDLLRAREALSHLSYIPILSAEIGR